MKTLNLQQMEVVEGGKMDGSNEGRISLVAGAAIGGAIFFGWVALLQVMQLWRTPY